LYMLSRKLTLSLANSLLNSSIAITSLYVILIIFEAPWDIFTHAFMLVAIYGFVSIFRSKQISLKYILITIIGLGCSVLSKGPVSIYALLLPFLISYGVIYRKEFASKKWITIVLVLLIGASLGFSWYLYVRYADPETFAVITSKETGNWTSYNVRPFYYYWSFFTQSGLWTIPAFISLLYPYLKTRVSNLKAYQFTWVWTLLAVVLLSIIPEKKSRYLMPVLIPLAMNIGFYIAYLVRRFKDITDKRETIPVYITFGTIGLLYIANLIVLLFITIYTTYTNVTVSTYLFGIPLFFCGLFILRNLFVYKSIKRVLILLILGLILLVNGLGTIRSKTMFNKGYTDFSMFFKKERLPFSTPVYAYKNTTPEMVWARGGKISVVQGLSDVKEDVFYLILSSKDENELIIEEDENIKDFKIKPTAYPIDLNFELPTSGNYKDRKVGYIYKLTKRE